MVHVMVCQKHTISRDYYRRQLGTNRYRDQKAKRGDKPYKMADGGNLYLLVNPSGGKLWRWAYHFEGRQKLMTFGKYPEVSLARVRERHAKQRAILADGIDPMARMKALKTATKDATENSFSAVAALWVEHWQQGKSPRHVDSIRRRLAADVLPCLGSRPIQEIEVPELVAMAKAIEQRGAVHLAKRALEMTGQVFRYAIGHGKAKRNPASEIKPGDILKSVQKTNHARIDAKELPELLRNVEVYRGTHVTRLAIKLLALTFVRTSELIEAKWSEFDLEERRWEIQPNG